MLLALIQNGLNLLGISPFAFKVVVGVVILSAITVRNLDRLLPKLPVAKTRGQADA